MVFQLRYEIGGVLIIFLFWYPSLGGGGLGPLALWRGAPRVLSDNEIGGVIIIFLIWYPSLGGGWFGAPSSLERGFLGEVGAFLVSYHSFR